MPKNILRKSLLAQRKHLPSGQAAEASLQVQENFIASPFFMMARVVALYAPVHNEVATELIFNSARQQGKDVLYPAVEGNQLCFRKVNGLDELVVGRYGVREPDAKCEAVDPAVADAVVVPGVAFDVNGRRLGYGKGFYDRALHKLEGNGKLVALCYDFQLLNEIADEPHDVRMDLVISEKRVICPRHLHI